MLDWISWGALFLGAALLFAYIIRSFKKPVCPVCGSREVEKIPKEWVTAPYTAYRGGPTTVTSHYKYRCRKCQNEWEDY